MLFRNFKFIQIHSNSFKLITKFSLILFLAISIFSCTDSENIEEITSKVNVNKKVSTANFSTLKENPTILGKKLNDPYTVEQMSLAWDKLSSTKRLPSKENILKTTHYYIKFIPKSEEELDILKKDSTLILYEYPLDYEIIKQGDYYREANLPKDQPTYQYASVSVDKDLPKDVEYEILKNLFIPDEFKIGQKPSINLSAKLINELVDISIAMAQSNPTDPNPDDITEIAGARWIPSGRIRVWDNSIVRANGTSGGAWVGVHGAIVKARRWYTTHTGMVNEAGFYSCGGSFDRPANYSIDWERYDYSIRSGAVGQAWVNGPKQRGDWNLDINSGDIHQFYAFIHLAAHQYYYLRDIQGLKTPPKNGTWRPQVKIGGYDEQGTPDHEDDVRFFGIRNLIRIYRVSPRNFLFNSADIYHRTIHELAHASHWELRRNDWDAQTTLKLKESWAIGVAHAFTKLRYPAFRDPFEDMSFGQMTNSNNKSKNTSLVIDLMDNKNQGITITDLPFDRVERYALVTIENQLSECKNIEDLRDRLKAITVYPNPTAPFLDELFEQYINFRR